MTVTLSGAASRTVTTGTDGSYQFTALSDGTYTIAQTQPSGFNDGKDTIGLPALGTANNDQFVGITLAGNNVQATNYNFGERPIEVVPNNSIGGFVYIDANDNGVFDIGEQPIGGVTITLSGAASRTVTTGTDGSYQFTALSDGTYTIAQTQPSGFNDEGYNRNSIFRLFEQRSVFPGYHSLGTTSKRPDITLARRLSFR